MTRNPSSPNRALRSVPALVPVAVALAVATSPASPPVAATSPDAQLAAPASFSARPAAPTIATADTVSFADDVLPIFRARCAKCHGGVGEDGEVRTEVSLNLLEYDGVMAGSEFGPVVDTVNTENSYLLDVIVEGNMPEEGDPVPEDEIAVIRAWIEAGAPNN